MIQIVRAGERHFSDFGWLKTYWLFSFDTYYDPRNLGWGALRVFNDDIVEPGEGFPTHPHREMEIVTIPLSGEITHRDSMGNEAVIRAGEVQRMSAGTGLTHSEYNLAEEPVHFYQIWILPDTGGLKPTYDQRRFDPASWRNRLLPLASGQVHPGAVTIHTDAAIYRAALDPGRRLEFAATPARRIFLYVARGELELDGEGLEMNDQARIVPDTGVLRIAARKAADVMVIDVPSRGR